MSDLLFIYGTLKLPEVQRQIIGREVELVSDTLNGYTTQPVVIDGVEYRTLVTEENAQVEGAVISVTSGELARIDAYEPPEYNRIKVVTTSSKPAWVYVKI